MQTYAHSSVKFNLRRKFVPLQSSKRLALLEPNLSIEVGGGAQRAAAVGFKFFIKYLWSLIRKTALLKDFLSSLTNFSPFEIHFRGREKCEMGFVWKPGPAFSNRGFLNFAEDGEEGDNNRRHHNNNNPTVSASRYLRKVHCYAGCGEKPTLTFISQHLPVISNLTQWHISWGNLFRLTYYFNLRIIITTSAKITEINSLVVIRVLELFYLKEIN